jgi:hypothetical protein
MSKNLLSVANGLPAHNIEKHSHIRKSKQLPIQLAAERGLYQKGYSRGMERSERPNEKRNESALHRIYLASLPPR